MARQKAIIPEVVEPDAKLPPDLVALRKFAYLMDEAVAIPGTGRRVGLDAGLGLIPGVGDAIAALLSTWIVVGALRHRVPLRKVIRMILNILVDLVIGEIPLIGDIFDFLFEENLMNLQLLLRYRDRSLPPRSLWAIAGSVVSVFLVILAANVVVLAAVIAAVLWIVHLR
jgi:hypothetical protein